MFCRTLAKLVIFVQLLHYCCQYGLYEPYLLLTNSSFILMLSESRRGDVFLFGSNLSRFRSKNLKARSLISDKARCFSQLEGALYGNFIIINNI